MTAREWGPWTRDVQPVLPEPEVVPPVIPSKGYVLELVTGPRDEIDEQLRREAGGE